MTHRDVRVSLYGVVLGVILGAGALGFVQSGSFLGSTVAIRPEVLLHGAPSPGDYTQRNISKKGIPLRGGDKTNFYPTIKSDETQSSSSPAAKSATTCDAVLATIGKIQGVYNAVVPDTVKNTEIRQRMAAIFADASDDYCPKTTAVEATSSSSSPSVPTVNNDCGKYPSHSIRYTQCVIAEKIGKKYP